MAKTAQVARASGHKMPGCAAQRALSKRVFVFRRQHCKRIIIMMESAASDSNRMAADQVANLILERMQQSGERDRIKEWLINDLESSGWTSTLLEKAAQLRASSEKSTSEHTSAVDASSSSQRDRLTVRNMSSLLSKDALASVPESVRAKLMQELLDVCRQYVSSENVGGATQKPNK